MCIRDEFVLLLTPTCFEHYQREFAIFQTKVCVRFFGARLPHAGEVEPIKLCKSPLIKLIPGKILVPTGVWADHQLCLALGTQLFYLALTMF